MKEHIENVLTDSKLEYLDIPDDVLNVDLKWNYVEIYIQGWKLLKLGARKLVRRR